MGWGREVEERICKSFVGLLFLHACICLVVAVLEVRLGAPLQSTQNGSGKVQSMEKSSHSIDYQWTKIHPSSATSPHQGWFIGSAP